MTILLLESDGRRWVTREPAIVYFHRKYWFNILRNDSRKWHILLLQSSQPYYLDIEALKYIDYDLDVKVFADGKTPARCRRIQAS